MEQTNAHRQEASSRMSVLGKKFFNLIEFDDNEQFLHEIRKHPFGLFLIEAGGFMIALLLGFIPIAIAFTLDSVQVSEVGGDTAAIKAILTLVGFVLAILSIGATFIAALIYRNNVIYVTNEKIAQVIYTSLFNRKLSQLSIGDVQDVTVTQNGMLPRLFKYGTLVIETAGEQQNYSFNYVPNPYETSRIIIAAHEENVKLYGN